jgi:hypothetical protein
MSSLALMSRLDDQMGTMQPICTTEMASISPVRTSFRIMLLPDIREACFRDGNPAGAHQARLSGPQGPDVVNEKRVVETLKVN